ncbi:MAG: penicillin-binding protein 2 [Patescibacteria group bacterium]|nr:penicillin-binding protein 2 [Patescibacteria group bacterium]
MIFGDEHLKKRKLKNSHKEDIEPHEVVLDRLVKEKEEEWGLSERKIEVPLLRRILQLFLLFSVLVIFALFLVTFRLQIIEGEKFSALANKNKFIVYKIQAERGVIYDKNMKQLVFNLPNFRLIYNKNNLPESEIERERVLREVSQILKIDYQDIKQKIEDDQKPAVLIAESLDLQTLIVLETKIEELPGFNIEKTLIRDYMEGENFSHLIGYMGKIKTEELSEAPEFYSILDYTGRTGIERSFENILRKNPGKMKIERDVLGNILSREVENLPESGKSLVLWLDSDLQKKIKEELEKQLKAIGAKKAVAIALDPKTGGVLSLVSIPSFDNNIFSKGDAEKINEILQSDNEPLFNRAISGRYPVGSTIKPLVALAALEEDIISPNKKINCQGKITIQDFWDPEKTWEYKDWRILGWTDMRKAIAESCNVFFYQIGGGYKDQEGLGPTNLKNYLELFGWGERTGIDLPGESKGFIPDKEWKKRVWGQGWWDGDTYLFSIGQGYLLITPLEVVTGFLPIANSGKLLKPQIVKEIIDTSEGELKIIEKISSEIIRENFVDQKNIQIVREGMRQAVTGKNSPHASAVLLNSLPVSSAAKTGTAETPKEDIFHNWITVFAPYEDPEIILTIMIEDVRGFRSTVVPAAKEILNWYFSK